MSAGVGHIAFGLVVWEGTSRSQHAVTVLRSARSQEGRSGQNVEQEERMVEHAHQWKYEAYHCDIYVPAHVCLFVQHANRGQPCP